MNEPAGESVEPSCPDCGSELQAIDPAMPLLLRCVHCGRETFLANDDNADNESETASEILDDRADELDGVRIRQLATGRRAAYRARSYAVIASIVCSVAAGDLVYHAAIRIRDSDWSAWTIAYIVFAIAAAMGAILFFRRANEMHCEASEPPMTNPSAAPDFSQLGDGAEQWKRLEEVE